MFVRQKCDSMDALVTQLGNAMLDLLKYHSVRGQMVRLLSVSTTGHLPPPTQNNVEFRARLGGWEWGNQ